MIKSIGSILSLLLGTAFLLVASGLHGLLLPLRGQMEGFSPAMLGMLGTSWAAGFIAGCYIAPYLVKRVGHIRTFSAFAATAAVIALMTGLIVDIYMWIALRAITGLVMAGAYMVIESWLNERSTNETRGTVFAMYMIVTHAAITMGQMTVAFSDVKAPTLFMITGIFFCLALVPTAISSAASPAPLTTVKLDLKALYVNSPISFIACILIGIANGAWGTLGAVFGAQVGLSTAMVATMMSVAVLSGALGQFPMGRLSDHTDRRYVLTAAATFCGIIGLSLYLFNPGHPAIIITLLGCYGFTAYTLYSVTVAHANDHASAGAFVQVSSGLLMLYGVGTMIGPLIGGFLMEASGPSSLFLVTFMAHLSIALYCLYRIKRRAPVPIAEREAFNPLPSERASTPQASVLDPRTGENPSED